MQMLIAFAAGLVSFFAPCGVALLPSFFAYTFKSRTSLVRATFWFLLGFLTLFLPFGLGVRAFTSTLLLHRRELSLFGGALFVLLGVAALFGRGVHIPLPGALSRKKYGDDAGSAYLVGMVFGFTLAGCAAPLIALVFSLAAAGRDSLLSASSILIAYSLGLSAPLFGLALAADRTSFLDRLKKVRGEWTFRVGTRSRTFPRANVVAAAMLFLLGGVFAATQGTFFLDHASAHSFAVEINVRAARFLYGLGR